MWERRKGAGSSAGIAGKCNDMMGRVCAGVMVAGLAAIALSGCGGDGDEQTSGATPATPSTIATASTTTTEEGAREGDPIAEPVCEFVGVSDGDASAILGFAVTSKSAVGTSDPRGGSCTLTPTAPSPDAFEVVIAAFPDTKDDFTSYINRYTEEKTERTGNRLWTAPVEVPDLGEAAYSFGSPYGGFDNVWLFADGYRVLVTDQNRSDVPGAAEKIQALAQQAAANV
jgi:hypothetical protein